jgi:type IV secretion system protein VirB4
MIHVDAVRRPAPTYSERGLSAFPDAITAAIDEERRRLFEELGTMYEGYFVLTLTFLPPLLNERKFIELMFDDDVEPPSNKHPTRDLLNHFSRECHNIETRLSSALKLTRLV